MESPFLAERDIDWDFQNDHVPMSDTTDKPNTDDHYSEENEKGGEHEDERVEIFIQRKIPKGSSRSGDVSTSITGVTEGTPRQDPEDKGKKWLMEQKAAWKSLVLLVALSLHTVFDGLMVGLQDSLQSLWPLLAAITLHKALVSASVSLSLFESHHHHPKTTLTYFFLFSLVAPVGLTVGTILTETSFDVHAQALTSGVLQSLAAGTFMYVTFVESFQGRFEDGSRSTKLRNIVLLIIGYGVVFATKLLLP